MRQIVLGGLICLVNFAIHAVLVAVVVVAAHRAVDATIALRPIRRLMPNLGGVDISPVILLLGLFFLREALRYYVWPHFY